MMDTNAFVPMSDTIEALSPAECEGLLRTQVLGRVGMTSGGLPLILPVHYVYDDGVIVFRTGGGSKLRAAASGDVLAFEVDAYDQRTGRGWSVLVLGRATVVSTAHELNDLPTLDRSDGDAERSFYVRLHCEMVTGRFIEPAPA